MKGAVLDWITDRDMGRHFGSTVHTMCNVQAVVTNDILHMGEDLDEESLTDEYVLSFIVIGACGSN